MARSSGYSKPLKDTTYLPFFFRRSLQSSNARVSILIAIPEVSSAKGSLIAILSSRYSRLSFLQSVLMAHPVRSVCCPLALPSLTAHPSSLLPTYSSVFVLLSYFCSLSLSLSLLFLSAFLSTSTSFYLSISQPSMLYVDLLKRSACSRSEHHDEEGRWLSGEGIDRQQHDDRGR